MLETNSGILNQHRFRKPTTVLETNSGVPPPKNNTNQQNFLNEKRAGSLSTLQRAPLSSQCREKTLSLNSDGT